MRLTDQRNQAAVTFEYPFPISYSVGSLRERGFTFFGQLFRSVSTIVSWNIIANPAHTDYVLIKMQISLRPRPEMKFDCKVPVPTILLTWHHDGYDAIANWN